MNKRLMKRSMIILLILILILALASCGSKKAKNEGDSEGQNTAMNFVGDYVCDRATVHIEAADSDNGMKADVVWGGSAFDAAEWVMSGTFDPETLQFEYHDCIKTEYVYDENGDVKSQEEVYTGGHGFMHFTDGEELSLTWQEDQEHVADGMEFKYLTAEFE